MEVVGRDWGLFCDWCAATGACALPATVATVERFAESVGGASSTRARRVRAVRAMHARHGYAVPHGTSGGHDTRSIPFEDAVRRIPVQGWPEGVTGRRDGFVLALLGAAGLTRRQVRELATSGIEVDRGFVVVGGVELTASGDPASCPVCACTRWLRLLAPWTSHGRAAVRRVLAGQHVAAPVAGGRHDCGLDVPGAWRDAVVLVPSVDRHGWMSEVSLSGRAMTAITASRCEPEPEPLSLRTRADMAGVAENPAPSAKPVRPAVDLSALDAILDRLDHDAAAAAEHARRVLDEAEPALARAARLTTAR